jgi:hypothetical protein
MDQQSAIEIIDQHGWRKSFPLRRSLTRIGSHPTNDIVLGSQRGEGIAARHLQVIVAPDIDGYRLVNVSSDEVALGGDPGQVLSPRSAVDVAPGERIAVGEYTLVFRGHKPPAQPGRAPAAGAADQVTGVTGGDQVSDVIGLSLTLARAELAPDRPITGSITVQNRGEQTGVQFRLTLEGLPADCYDLGPGPILFPDGEREVRLEIAHPRRPQPLAGPHRIRVCAAAPDAYPGERATASQVIEVLPFYHHDLHITVTA